jgi:hypothetical protein
MLPAAITGSSQRTKARLPRTKFSAKSLLQCPSPDGGAMSTAFACKDWGSRRRTIRLCSKVTPPSVIFMQS